MSLSVNFPSIAPSLNLDFAGSERLDPRITFTRATTARYYDGVTTTKAEENLLLRSQEFNVSPWSGIDTTISANTGDTTAPDGTSTAEKVTDNAVSGGHTVNQTFTTSPNSLYVFSVFLKKGTNQHAVVVMFSAAANQNYVTAIADLDAGTITKSQNGTSTTNASTSITSVGNGWYRVSVVGSASTAFDRFRFGLIDSGTPTIGVNGLPSVYAGTLTDIYAWGAQLEQRSAVTAYTPTTTERITNYIPVLLTAPAGVARFDHNPITGESLGLLVEEQRTNLLLQSEDLGTTWGLGSGGTLTTNAWVSPAGTLTGDIFTIAADSTVPSQTVTVLNSTTYTLSFYVNKTFTTAAFLRMRFGIDGGSISAWFDVQNLTFGTFGSGLSNGTVTAVGNNVYRVTVQMAYNATSGGIRSVAISATTTNNGTTADTGKNIAIWGIQYEQGAFPTSYIPTVGSTVTRNADAASMTGVNFSSWYRADEGSLFMDADRTGFTTNFGAVFDINDNSAPNRLGIGISASDKAQAISLVNNVVQANNTSTNDIGSGKAIFAYKVDDFALSCNGASVITDTSGILPVVTQMNIGRRADTGNQFTGTIKKFSYYPTRLSDAQLQALTR